MASAVGVFSVGSCDEGRDDVGGVEVEGDTGAVVTDCGSWVGMAGCFSDMATPASSAAMVNAARNM
jgi:hypothetical protein